MPKAALRKSAKQSAGIQERRDQERAAINKRMMAVIKEQGLTQADLVRASGVSSPTVTDWFNRGAVPDAATLGRISKVLHVNVHWLCTGHGPRTLPGEGRTTEDQIFKLSRENFWEELNKHLQMFAATLLGRTAPIARDEVARAAAAALDEHAQQQETQPPRRPARSGR